MGDNILHQILYFFPAILFLQKVICGMPKVGLPRHRCVQLKVLKLSWDKLYENLKAKRGQNRNGNI